MVSETSKNFKEFQGIPVLKLKRKSFFGTFELLMRFEIELEIISASSEATCTWVGQLPPKNTKNPLYSCKVFLGGVPWDITELQLQQQFKQFGPVTVDWPGKDKNHSKNPPSGKG